MGEYEDEALASRAAPDDDGSPEEEGTTLYRQPSSLLDSLRAIREEATHEHRLDVTVPGYSGRVALHCAPISGRTQSALAARIAKSRSPEAAFEAAADMLIAACEEVVVRDSWQDEWQSLGSLNGGAPVGLGDEELVTMLKLEPREKGRAREVLRSLFALAPAPEVAVTQAVNEYLTWAGATESELDEDFAGNSRSAGR